ncbi:BTAD domain-containing putative transcriptional regulator [Deinococcus hopiensis]|nr:BTAD domain-containing putative transcriptional regulator [Deinococcus hopiensis]
MLALLAYLAVEGPTPRALLASLLWPTSSDSVGRNNLVHLLRRIASMSRSQLTVSNEAVALNPAVWTDVGVLTAGEALSAFRLDGAFLENAAFNELPEFDDWVHLQRERLLQLALRRLNGLRAQAELDGELGLALEYAVRLSELDNLSEETHRHLMRLHYLNGDRGAALSAYRYCTTVLLRELGVQPMPETARLAEEIAQGGQAALLPSRKPNAIPLSIQRPPVLVGRDHIWRQMEHARDQGHVIFLVGEAGTGKSRLAEEFAASHGTYLRVEGRPGDAHELYASALRLLRRHLAQRPYVPPTAWERRALAHLLPEFGPVQVDSWNTLHFQQATLNLVRETSRDVQTFITDDLQYYDQASFDLGGFMLASAFPLGQPGGLPHFVDTYRKGELPPATERAIQDLVDANLATIIEVPPLGEGAADELMDTLGVPPHPDWRRRLWQHSGGNLVFLLETMKYLIELGAFDSELPDRLPLPAKVQQMISARVTRLSAPALQVARAAAALQRDFTVEIVAEVLQAPLLDVAERWGELERAQIMSGERFTHDSVAQTIFSETPEFVRKLLHRNAARSLERHQANPGQIAWQWQAGANDKQAAVWFVQAGESALHAHRPLEARVYFEQAQQAFARCGDEMGRAQSFTAWTRLEGG